MVVTVILIGFGIFALISLIVRFFTWLAKVGEPVPVEPFESNVNIDQPRIERPEPEHSEEYKQFQIKHMIQIVQIRLHQETGKIVPVPWPENEKDKNKLKEMYNRALEKYS